ncbi:glycosyltransferase family 4 protein [Marivita geojedonensis]|uniref:glycosyltransferase family 4 protein n=1 Tax=Marivita geojedonensis TaxID=1123756 RepID=UPI000D4D3A82|nr:glycosyltransferase involved in cell wall biosynthesis [Marivita geojedonensis]
MFPLIRTNTGSEVWTRRLATLLADRGHRVALEDVAHGFQYAPWLAPIRIPDETDVIIANSWSASAFARKGIPLVSINHLVVQDPLLAPFKSFPQAQFHKMFVTPMELAAAQRAQKNVAVSSYVARKMQELLGIEDVSVIENAVDTEFFCPSERPRQTSEKFRLLFVGNPSRRKGFDLIAQVMEALGDRVQLTCVGPKPGPTLPRPEATYTGLLDRTGVREAYRDADLLLFPSRAEGFGYAAAEALSCGLPVICSGNTAVAEIVDKTCSITCRANDVEKCVEAILSLSMDPSRHEKMKYAARQYARTRFAESRWADAFEALLFELHNKDLRRR